MTEDLREVRVTLNMSGITRRQAARALNLACSTLNRKLRGEIKLRQEETEQLTALAKERRGTA